MNDTKRDRNVLNSDISRQATHFVSHYYPEFGWIAQQLVLQMSDIRDMHYRAYLLPNDKKILSAAEGEQIFKALESSANPAALASHGMQFGWCQHCRRMFRAITSVPLTSFGIGSHSAWSYSVPCGKFLPEKELQDMCQGQDSKGNARV
jgi:hypothetical protein